MSRSTLALLGFALASLLEATSASANDDPPSSYDQQSSSVYSVGAPTAAPNAFHGEPAPRVRAVAVPRQVVAFHEGASPGTIVISTRERRLYYVLGNGQAIRYGVGVGRTGFAWAGTKTVTMKRQWPDWRPPAQMLRRRPDLPRHMKGGLANPLGARAMYLGGSLYRIHGSNEPETIGQAVSSGCIRMTNEDVIDLYERVKVGTRVVVR